MLHAQLLKNPVRQSLEADNIDVHTAMIGMKGHDLLLGLHGKLFRNNGDIIAFRMFHG